MSSWCFVAIAYNTYLQNILRIFVILEKKKNNGMCCTGCCQKYCVHVTVLSIVHN